MSTSAVSTRLSARISVAGGSRAALKVRSEFDWTIHVLVISVNAFSGPRYSEETQCPSLSRVRRRASSSSVTRHRRCLPNHHTLTHHHPIHILKTFRRTPIETGSLLKEVGDTGIEKGGERGAGAGRRGAGQGGRPDPRGDAAALRRGRHAADGVHHGRVVTPRVSDRLRGHWLLKNNG
jgi:hypothetical protein